MVFWYCCRASHHRHLVRERSTHPRQGDNLSRPAMARYPRPVLVPNNCFPPKGFEERRPGRCLSGRALFLLPVGPSTAIPARVMQAKLRMLIPMRVAGAVSWRRSVRRPWWSRPTQAGRDEHRGAAYAPLFGAKLCFRARHTTIFQSGTG
jgi:hypothetical protein